MPRKHVASLIWGSALILGAIGTVYFVVPGNRPKAAAAARLIPRETILDKASRNYAAKPDIAAAHYRDFVRAHDKDRDPKVQDEVGMARIHLGYLAAHRKDFKSARAEFQIAARTYRGTGVMNADFGGIPDQAAYQAAVCLVAENKPDEAAHEFRRFIKERPLSPLVYAARKRLIRLKKEDTNQDDELLQVAITKQEAKVRFETSVCGPKCLEYILPLLGKPARDYKALARLCGTTDRGTSIQGLRDGLKALGIQSFGYEFNASDFRDMPLPAILMVQDHFVVVKAMSPSNATVYDPMTKAEMPMPLPKLSDSTFKADVILFSIPTSVTR